MGGRLIFIGLLFHRWVIRGRIELTSICLLVSLYRTRGLYLPWWILWSSLFSSFPGWSLAWFLFFPQDTQKRYPYQGRLCLPLFCPSNVFLTSALCFFCCLSIWSFAVQSVLFWFIAHSVVFFCLLMFHPKEKKYPTEGLWGVHPVTPVQDYSLIPQSGFMQWFISVVLCLFQNYAFFFMPCVFNLVECLIFYRYYEELSGLWYVISMSWLGERVNSSLVSSSHSLKCGGYFLFALYGISESNVFYLLYLPLLEYLYLHPTPSTTSQLTTISPK